MEAYRTCSPLFALCKRAIYQIIAYLFLLCSMQTATTVGAAVEEIEIVVASASSTAPNDISQVGVFIVEMVTIARR